MKKHQLVTLERIEGAIFYIRGYKVMIDTDIAHLYGVTTKILNRAVKRNKNRFPETFMFRLTSKEIKMMRYQIGTASKRNARYHPYVFTEHGAVMLASLLNSPTAIRASIQVVQTFVKLRQLLATHKDLARRLDELEQKYDSHFKIVFDAIRRLMTPPRTPKKKLGFRPNEQISSRSQIVTLKGGRKLRPVHGKRSGHKL